MAGRSSSLLLSCRASCPGGSARASVASIAGQPWWVRPSADYVAGGDPTGRRPVTVVPQPGSDSISTAPPNADRRSAMFWSPEPCGVAVVSNPDPSSVTRKTRKPPSIDRTTLRWEAVAYLAAFCIASKQQKYTAASASGEYRTTPSLSTLTGRWLLRACADRAAGSPLSAKSDG